ncbi:MAG: hypothetical protein CFE24_09725 [Flavobacterium sp. BFFFF2]|nr:MAG: hypothetical protein CFE24_09725 [Flavobacterium sp. BFFFF2]
MHYAYSKDYTPQTISALVLRNIIKEVVVEIIKRRVKPTEYKPATYYIATRKNDVVFNLTK